MSIDVTRLIAAHLGVFASGSQSRLVPYLDPYRSCLMCLMRLLDVLVERG